VPETVPNAADAAWEELLSLRERAADLGIAVKESWPIAQVRRQIEKALAGIAAPGLPEIVQALKLEPGQTLIVRFSPDRNYTRQHVDAVADLLAKKMPDHHFLIVVADELAVAEPAEAGGDRA
jgi:hypothetical protein